KIRGLVQIRKLDDSVAQAMRVISSPQEWWERGKKVLLNQLFFFFFILTIVATSWYARSFASLLSSHLFRLLDVKLFHAAKAASESFFKSGADMFMQDVTGNWNLLMESFGYATYVVQGHLKYLHLAAFVQLQVITSIRLHFTPPYYWLDSVL
ncbi:hypothetical protein Tco_0773772, partial [Tanacetum coccineum]